MNETENICDVEDLNSDEEINNESEDTSSPLFPIYLKGGRVLYKRKKNKVIRFVNYRKHLDPENFYREKLLLYTPWRYEEKDLYHGQKNYKEAYEIKREIIFLKMKEYEPLSQILKEAEDQLENERQEIFTDIAPSTKHENSSLENSTVASSNAYEYFDP